MRFLAKNGCRMMLKLVENCMCSVKMETWISNTKRAARINSQPKFKYTTFSYVNPLSYLVPRPLYLRIIFVPVTFRVPLEVVNSPASPDSSSFPSKLISNFRSPNSRTVLKLTLLSSRLTFLMGMAP